MMSATHTAYCIGSFWGSPVKLAQSLRLIHYWQEKDGGFGTLCGQHHVLPDDFLGSVPAVNVVLPDAMHPRYCPACKEQYPETQVGKVMNGKVIPVLR